MALFKIEDLTYWYPGGDRPALMNVNLEIEEGELLLIAGGSGSGKSTLARFLAGLAPYFYGGRQKGRVLFKGRDLRELDPRSLATRVGVVFQDPEKQLVMTSVEAEIAFGLENLGLPQEEMSRRIAEVASFLNLTSLKGEFTANLSGGQKQRVALAAVLAMQPEVLVLDEPTSQLDPVAAEEFFHLVERLNKEMGYTVVLIEQRLERCIHLADRLVVMEEGKVLKCGRAEEVARWEVENRLSFLPPVARLFASLGTPTVPLTVKEGRKELKRLLEGTSTPTVPGQQGSPPAQLQDKQRQLGGSPSGPRSWRRVWRHKMEPQVPELVELKGVWFTYPNGREALRGVNLKVSAGEFMVIMGENAAGKTTLLKHMVGLLKPGRGKVFLMGTDTRAVSLPGLAHGVGYLSQNPNDYLFRDTVEDELRFTLANLGLEDDGVVDATLERLGLVKYRKANPRDLSSGERQRVALASVIVARPRLLLLDEPTRGLDCRLKRELGCFLAALASEGVAVVMVTHDVEFAAEYAWRVVIISDGRVICDGPKHEVLGSSLFYSPQMTRLFRGFDEGVLTVEEGMERLSRRGVSKRCLAAKAES